MPYSHLAVSSWAIVGIVHQAAEICFIIIRYYTNLDTRTLVNLLFINNSLIYKLFVTENYEITVIFSIINLLLY